MRSAIPSITAKRKCPKLIFVKPRFDIYKAASQQMRERLSVEIGARIEQVQLARAGTVSASLSSLAPDV